MDAKGVVHYSSKPIDGQAQPAKLPRITRADMKLPGVTLSSCGKHGGIDCSAGADVDGSVICVDGFRDATARYRFHCNMAKLVVSEVKDKTPDGRYTVVIRNSASVAAGKVAVFFTRPDRKEVPLDGPASIKPLGVGEYVLDKTDAEGLLEKPKQSQLRVVCSNCP